LKQGAFMDNQGNETNKAKLGADIKEYGAPLLPVSPIQVISIIGQIEGHVNLPPENKATKYEHIIPQLVLIEQNPEVKGMLLLMNTSGGDVEAGLALAEMIAGMSKPTVSLVLGGGHSIGITLAVSTKYSFITPTASVTVHPIRMNGTIIGVPQTFDYFDKMQQRIVRFISSHSKISESEYRRLMMQTGGLANDMGSVLVGREVVDCGIIDEIGTFVDASRKLKSLAGMKDAPTEKPKDFSDNNKQ
jgi:ATP-dependent protease ClpP protease subunit